MTDRRAFMCAIAGSLVAMPRASRAQQPGKVYRIGLLRVGAIPLSDAFWGAMRELGWIEGRNVKIEPRYADRDAQLPALAGELVRSKVDLITTIGTAAAQAAKQATKTIPIVFGLGLDPVGSGLVANMARPGENITGFVVGVYDDKLLQILKEALPGVSRVAYPTVNKDRIQVIQFAAKALGVQAEAIALGGAEDIGPFFAAARKSGAGAVMIPNIVNLVPHLARIGSESVRTGLPAIGYTRVFADSGGLMSYGPISQADLRLAAQIDKILGGAKPGDLPVEQPTKFELVINLKTAKALGLTIPQSLLLRADEVIQ